MRKAKVISHTMTRLNGYSQNDWRQKIANFHAHAVYDDTSVLVQQ